jgi:hypothetical protein
MFSQTPALHMWDIFISPEAKTSALGGMSRPSATAANMGRRMAVEAMLLVNSLTRAVMDTARDTLTVEAETLRAQWNKEKQHYEAKLRERRERDTKKRKRQEEEYEYSFAQERQRAQEQFEAQKASLDQEMQALREQTERDIVQKGLELAQREEEFTALQAQVKEFPQRLETAVVESVQENTERLERASRHQMELQENEWSGERRVLLTRIQSLEKTIKRQREHITKLTKQQDVAYRTIQKLTVKAIEGAGKACSFDDLERLLKEQGQRQAKED